MASAKSRELSVPDHVVWKELGGEMVLLDLQSGEYLTLSETAAFIYLRVARGEAEETVLAEMMQTYEGDEAVMKQKTADFLDEMLEVGYLTSGGTAGG